MKKFWHRYLTASMAVCAWAVASVSSNSAEAATIVYDNTSTAAISGVSFNNAQLVGGNLIANLDIDDLTLRPGYAGQLISSLSFVGFNFNAAAVTARPTFFLWASNATGTAPSAFLGSITLPTASFAANSANLLTANISNLGILVPTGKLWAGVVYDNNFGTIGITANLLGGLGGSVYTTPTVGSSDGLVADYILPTVSPGVSDPSVIPFNFGNNPPVNYGWQVQVVSVVPEPSTFALLGIGLIFAAAWAKSQRKVARTRTGTSP